MACVRTYDAAHLLSDERHTNEKKALYSAGAKPLPGADHKDSVVLPHELATQLELMKLPRYTARQRRAFLRRFFSARRLGPNVARPTLTIGRSLFSSANAPTHEVHGYANFWQDIALYTHFFSFPHPVLNGVYVEIGGQDGVSSSNTLFFEQHLNWTGILIEPSPCGRCVLPFLRPRDRTINAGACRAHTRIAPANLTDSRGRGFCHPPRDSCVSPGFTAPCAPMRELLWPVPARVDLFSIDVEANMMDVLETIPWDTMTIDVFIVETTGRHSNMRVSRYLSARGYSFLWARFGGDLVAVRTECVRPKPSDGPPPAGAWWARFFPESQPTSRIGKS